MAANSSVTVYRYNPEQPSQSIGRPNRGRLRYAVPFPEDSAEKKRWKLRQRRNVAWGTMLSIQVTIDAIEKTYEAYPGIPHPMNIGDLSKKRGRKVRPHCSHRSGRDLDIGYIFQEAVTHHRDPALFVRANKHNLDAEKTWFFIEMLLRTRHISMIFIDKRLKKLLYPWALKRLDRELASAIFGYGHSNLNVPHIIHARGHRNHMHIRFRCAVGDPRCRGH